MSLVTKLMQVVAKKGDKANFDLKVSLKGQFATLMTISDEGVVLYSKTGKVASVLNSVDFVVGETIKLLEASKSNLDLMQKAMSQGKTITINGTHTLIRINQKTVTIQDDITGKKKYMEIETLNKLSRDCFDIFQKEVA